MELLTQGEQIQGHWSEADTNWCPSTSTASLTVKYSAVIKSKVLNHTLKYPVETELTIYFKYSFDEKSLASLSMGTIVQDTSFLFFFFK